MIDKFTIAIDKFTITVEKDKIARDNGLNNSWQHRDGLLFIEQTFDQNSK
jgi:hypothetical protein